MNFSTTIRLTTWERPKTCNTKETWHDVSILVIIKDIKVLQKMLNLAQNQAENIYIFRILKDGVFKIEILVLCRLKENLNG